VGVLRPKGLKVGESVAVFEVVWEEVAEAFQTSMNEKTDVSRGQAGDFFDFLVAESLLEFQEDDFALVFGEAFQHFHDLGEALVKDAMFVRLEAGASDFFPTDVVERLEVLVLAKQIQRSVPANGEKP
jgi:hypothetical protein